MSKMNLNEIATSMEDFEIQGGIGGAFPFGSGHINDTYRIANAFPDCPDYLLQRINHQIFKDVPGLMDNIVYVTSHLKKKYKAAGFADADRRTLTPIPTKDGKYYWQDEEGQFWRLYLFLPDTHS